MQENLKNAHDGSNTEIIQQIQNGHRQAEKKLVQQHWRQLNLILIKRTGDHFLAEDLCQETFIIVIKKAREGAIEEPEAIAGFIHSVAKNLMLAHYKKENRRSTEADEHIVEQEDKSPGLFQLLSAKQRLELVTDLIDSLKTERDVLLLKYYYLYQKEKTEICSLLQLTPDHFDKVIYRAKNRLKDKIQKGPLGDSLSNVVSLHSLLIVALLVNGISDSPELNLKNNLILVRDNPNSHHLDNKSLGFSNALLSAKQLVGGSKIL